MSTEVTKLPAVVIVGRPNVGKSTLFNRITGQRRAIVGDEPGITRDRIQVTCSHEGRRFEMIDTGGIVVADAEYIPSQILRQARVALEDADQVIFVVDGRAEITAPDRELAEMLRRLGKPVTVAVNKADPGARESLFHQFHELGIGELFPVSAEHGVGVDAMMDHVTRDFPESEKPEELPVIRVAIIGRPNVGKSTLLNALTGSERSIVSPIAGTTRDTVDEVVEHDGVSFQFMDTAGIRRKGKTNEMAEKLSVVMARRHIRMSDVVLLMMDASDGVVALDATIAGYAHEGGRGVIVCINKWDLVSDQKRRDFEQNARDSLKFLEYAPVTFLVAKENKGTQQLFPLIREVYDSATKRVTTGELNRFVESLHYDERKILYITQAGVRPPSFVMFTDKRDPLHFSDQRFIVNQIRKRFGFKGTPIELKVRGRQRRKDR